MISISVGDKELRGISGAIDKFVVEGSFEIANEMLDCFPVFKSRIAIEASKYTNSVGDVRMSGGG